MPVKESKARAIIDTAIDLIAIGLVFALPQRTKDTQSVDESNKECTRTTQKTLEVAPIQSIKTEPERQKKGYWQKPNNYIRVATVVLLAVYTGITVSLFVTSKDTEQRQLRGYVYVVPTIDFEVGKPPLYKISVVNGGQTPVTHINGTLHAHTASPAQVGKPSGPPPGYASDPEIISSESDFAYQKKTFDYSLPIKEGIAVDQASYDLLFITRKSSLYIWGRIDFLDVFQHKHWLTYCYFYPSPKEVSDAGNTGECTHGNAMDSDE